ncbi:MAG: HEAT repeat domain-containing protein [Kineosporiaceae bacterium]
MALAQLLLAGQVRSRAYWSAVDAAGPEDVDAVLALVGHEDAGIRRAVASTLPLLSQGDPPTQAMVGACITLSADPDDSVRDWACCALGRQWHEVDTPELRDALAARLDDEHVDTRCEALVGLALRRDERALPRVVEALSRDTEEVWSMELAAAGALGDPRLHELVREHRDGWDDEDAERTAEAALRLTSPEGPGQDVVDGVAELYRLRAHGLDEGDAVTAWHLMDSLLDLAPHRAPEFLDLVLAKLDGDPLAQEQVRHQSALAVLAEAAHR